MSLSDLSGNVEMVKDRVAIIVGRFVPKRIRGKWAESTSNLINGSEDIARLLCLLRQYFFSDVYFSKRDVI